MTSAWLRSSKALYNSSRKLPDSPFFYFDQASRFKPRTSSFTANWRYLRCAAISRTVVNPIQFTNAV